MATKREPYVWEYNWASLSLGDVNTGTWSSRLGVGYKADDLALSKKYCYEIQRTENRINVAGHFKEGYGSRGAVFSMMMVMILMTTHIPTAYEDGMTLRLRVVI
jgi:hypothetical protein